MSTLLNFLTRGFFKCRWINDVYSVVRVSWIIQQRMMMRRICEDNRSFSSLGSCNAALFIWGGRKDIGRVVGKLGAGEVHVLSKASFLSLSSASWLYVLLPCCPKALCIPSIPRSGLPLPFLYCLQTPLFSFVTARLWETVHLNNSL